jgi:hypothetical protein
MTEAAFVDPRRSPNPPFSGPPRPPAEDAADLAGLVGAIDAGRFHEVECWIAAGDPLQFVYPANRRKSPKSPLQAAIRTCQNDEVRFLLCNG